MSNGNLNCSATNCGHNNSGLCYAGWAGKCRWS